jgi:hypothetical protein
VKHIYSTGVIDNRHLQLSKYFLNTNHCNINIINDTCRNVNDASRSLIDRSSKLWHHFYDHHDDHNMFIATGLIFVLYFEGHSDNAYKDFTFNDLSYNGFYF